MRRVWRIREEAEQELAAAVEWYEREHAGLGAALVAEYLATLRWLEEAPSRATPEPRVPRSLKVYRGRLRRFPYAVVFVELPDAYEVQALVHLRRRPGYWLPRLVDPG